MSVYSSAVGGIYGNRSELRVHFDLESQADHFVVYPTSYDSKSVDLKLRFLNELVNAGAVRELGGSPAGKRDYDAMCWIFVHLIRVIRMIIRNLPGSTGGH